MSIQIPFENHKQKLIDMYLHSDENELRHIFINRMSLPQKGESAALSFGNEKLVALCYDRVWDPIGIDIPDPIRYSGTSATEYDLFWLSIQLLQMEGSNSECNFLAEMTGLSSAQDNEPVLKDVVDDFITTHNFPIVPIYDSKSKLDHEYIQGNCAVIVKALHNLKIADNNSLSWPQVMQFRDDTDAHRKYRRLLHWLEKEMVGRPQDFIEDEIAQKLEDYEWALKKHGIKTVLGAISDTLDGKYLAGAATIIGSLSLAGHPDLGIFTGAGLVIGKVAVKLAIDMLELKDIERGPNSEIAAVYEIKKFCK